MQYRLAVVSVWCDVFTQSTVISFVSEVNGLPQLMQHLCVKNNKYMILFQFHPTSPQARRNSTWYRVQEGFWGEGSKSVCCCCKTGSFNSNGSKGKQGLLRPEKKFWWISPSISACSCHFPAQYTFVYSPTTI